MLHLYNEVAAFHSSIVTLEGLCSSATHCAIPVEALCIVGESRSHRYRGIVTQTNVDVTQSSVWNVLEYVESIILFFLKCLTDAL